MIRPHRTHPLWFAFLLHRLSGLGLALFLPIHFYMLSLAISAPARLDGFLRFTDLTIVKMYLGEVPFLEPEISFI